MGSGEVVVTQFRIDVIIDPKGATQGSRTVERELTRVETSANRVQNSLRRAFAFVTLGFAVREVTRYADSLTDLQNRLRLLVPEQAQLVRTTRDLLGVANDTRTALEGTVILYQRLGLATRELGVEGGDLLGIVRSINQALILSGASAKEANNGLIQLSQGIASNRLGGDELRSTLEQLPAVADVIARELGVTRGELRELGAEGKITGEIIIEAFRNAKDELEAQFGRTIPTLSQSFTVLRNNLIVFLGELNQGTGVLGAFGSILRFVGNNIEAIAKSLVVLGAAFAALRVAPIVQAFFQLQSILRSGNAVLLGSAEAARQKAAFDVEQARAAVVAAEAEIQKTRATLSDIAVQRQSTLVTADGTASALARAEADLQAAAARQRAADATVRSLQAEQARAAATTGIVQRQEALAAAEARLVEVRQASLQTNVLERASQAQLNASYEQLGAAFDRQVASVVALEAAENRLIAAEARLQKVTTSGTVKQIESAQAAVVKAQANAELALSNSIAADSEVDRLVSLIERTEAEAASTLVTQSSTNQALRQAEANRTVAASNLQQAETALAAAVGDTQIAAARKAVDVATEDLAEAQLRLAATQQAVNQQIVLQNAAQAQEAAVKARLREQTDALTAAQGRLGAASAAASAQSNIFRRALESIRGAFASITGVIVRNPIATFVVGLAAASTALFIFRDDIRLADDQLATLGDVFAEFADQVSRAFGFILDVLGDIFGPVINDIREFVGEFEISLRSVIEFTAAFADVLVGVFLGSVRSIGVVLGALPRLVASFFTDSVNAALDALEFLPDAVVAIVRTVGQILGTFIDGLFNAFSRLGEAFDALLNRDFGRARSLITQAGDDIARAFDESTSDVGGRFLENFAQELETNLVPRIDPVASDSLAEIGSNAASAFAEAFNANPVLGFVEGLFAGAEDRAIERDLADQARASAEARARAQEEINKQAAAVQQYVKALKEERGVLGTSILFDERKAEVQRQLIDINNQLAEQDLSPLTREQTEELVRLIERNQQLNDYVDLLQQVRPIEEEFAQRRRTINSAFADGAVNLEQYEELIRRLNREEAEAGTTIADGLEVGLQNSLDRLRDFSVQSQTIVETAFTEIEGFIAKAFEGAAEALLQFIQEGEFSFKEFSEFIREIFADALEAIAQEIGKLAAQQALNDLVNLTGFGAPDDTGTDQTEREAALLAQRQLIAQQEQFAATTLSEASTGLNVATSSLGTGAGTLSSGAGVLKGATAGLSPAASTLLNASTTLVSAIPGLQSAAATLLKAAETQLAANAAGGIAGAAGGAPTPAATGSTMALANKPFFIGEEGPELFVPGQTGSIIPTDRTMEALAQAGSGAGQTTVIQAPAPEVRVSVVNVTDPEEALSALDTPDGERKILNILQRNPEAVRRLS